MKIQSNSIKDSSPIPGKYAFGIPGNPVTLSDNINPHLAWSEAPAGTKSFVVTCIDVDVPSRGDDVNREGREVPSDLPRVEFVHWLMANIPANVTEIAEGSCSSGITAHGKKHPAGPANSVQGKNDYTGWFAGDNTMSGDYLGYDGPCPPWNDSIVHRYFFTVHALDKERLSLAPGFTLHELRDAMKDHVLASVSIHGTYTLNKRLL